MNAELTRLLALFPAHAYRREPMPVSALTVAYGNALGSVTLTVADDILQLDGVDGAPTRTIPLVAGVTLGDVATTLNTIDGVTAEVQDGADAVWALALLDEDHVPLVTDGDPITLQRFTNPLWQLLEALRLQLDHAVANCDAGVAQLNPLTAAAYFADEWGRYTVTPRRDGELDDAYTARQLRELQRPRENNFGLAQCIEDDTDVHVIEVADLEPSVFVVSGSPLRGRPLAGSYYNAATCEVLLDGFPTLAAIETAFGNAAAGIQVYVRGRQQLVNALTYLQLGGEPVRSVPPPSMQIGTGAIGIGKIG